MEKFALQECLVFGLKIVLQVTLTKRNELRPTSEKPKWKRWKMNIKDICENSHSAVTLFFYWLCLNMNESFWMEACFQQDPILISLDFYMNFTRMIKSVVNPRFSASSSIFKTGVINMKVKVVTHELCVKWIAFQYAWCIKTLFESTVLSSLSRALTSNFLSNLLIHKKKVLWLSWKDLL